MNDVAAVAPAASACVQMFDRVDVSAAEPPLHAGTAAQVRLKGPDHLAGRNQLKCVQHLRNPIFIW